jgi:hypothetical protein
VDTLKLILALFYLFVMLPWSIYLTIKIAQHVNAWPF